MNGPYLETLVERLRVWGVQFGPGLTDEEVSRTQTIYNLRFPPDLRAFLQHALPISKSWVNWRDEAEDIIRDWLALPADDICFDVEHAGFWMEAWGAFPNTLPDALAVARRQIAAAPTLIPVRGHRFLPEEPLLAGNPVLSVHQTDIVHYGNDLASYFSNEFSADPQILPQYHIPCPDWAARSPRPIRFWDDIVSGTGVRYSSELSP